MIKYESIFTEFSEKNIKDIEQLNNLNNVINEILSEGSSNLIIDKNLSKYIKIKLFYEINDKLSLIVDESNIDINNAITCKEKCLCINCRDEFLEFSTLLCEPNCKCINCVDENLPV